MPRAIPEDAKTCAVSGCRRWSRQFDWEFICGFHWMRLSRAERAVMRRIWRLINKVGRPADRQWQPALGNLRTRDWRVWQAVKRRAA